jgi:hypothetical protein
MIAIIGVLSLAVIASIVYQVVRKGSQGPAETTSIFNGVRGFYSTLYSSK